MNHLREALNRLSTREDGATAVEYAIMVALIAAVIIAAVVVIGNQASDSFDCVGQSIENGSAAANCS